MVYEFKFPDVGEGITEGELVKWRVKKGDKVKEDQVIAEIETAKAIVDVPSPRAGVIVKLNVKEGGKIKVGDTIVEIETGEKEERVERAATVIGEIPETLGMAPSATASRAAAKRGAEATKAIPAARILANKLGIELAAVKGTGPGGIITLDDIESFGKGQPSKPAAPEKKPALKIEKKYDLYGKLKRVPFKGIRKATAGKMSEAVARSALVTHMDEADVTALWELRETEKKTAEKKGTHLTFLPYIIKAATQTLKQHPYLNSELDEANEEIILKQYYNIGFAVATDEGLFAPVIKRADEKGLYDIAKEIELLVDKASKRKIDLGDLKGGTFTITNIGVIGGRFFTPIMNHPETAILGVGRIGDRAVVIDNKVVIRKIMPISLSYDHRVVDGAQAAYFVNDLKALLENPKKIK